MHLIFYSLFLLCWIITPSYSKCLPHYPCRNFTLEFPLTDVEHPDCGLFRVSGCNSSSLDDQPEILLGSKESSINILWKISTNKFLVRDLPLYTPLINRKCYGFPNISMPQSPSVSFTFSPNLTLFTCYKPYSNTNREFAEFFQNYNKTSCDVSDVYYKIPATAHAVASLPQGCVTNELPVKSENSSGDLFDILNADFSIEWSVSKACNECYHGGGQCLADNENKFYCKHGINMALKSSLRIGGTTIAALTSTLIILFVFIWRKRANTKNEHEKDIKLFLRNNRNLAPMRYKYSSIKKMTKSFSENLGKGGYGSVYKGQLPDGRLVAVKVLNESNGNGEEFMNEVASISRTSHINIVALLGFCFEGSKRALIYDFMPNGSLEKFIGNTTSSAAELGLGWDKLFEIALGIARGLEYLHQGCNTRILHLDIKPQNILLDKDLNPRISDFGLAKLCPNRSSIVSMLVARGTIGYIAPEVFSRNFGEVSYKSDVYSYGMVVLEMVGGRKNMDRGEVDHTSEIYFPHYIYKQLEMDSEVVATINEDESQVAKRNLSIVGLWCIQTNPKDRPSMTEVVQMLEGKLGALEVPPKPYLFSPPRSVPTISSTSHSVLDLYQ